jgi:DNA repair protein RecN (Recombination protein N)
MLTALSIRDFVLIDQLVLDFSKGFTSLTGETGAGKSILLDALGLALGEAPTRGQVRRGAERAIIVASFDPPHDHPARQVLAERGLGAPDEPIILRRVIPAEGSARAFVNDQAASAGLLAEIGETLVEVHGQHASVGLLNAAAHRALLDAYGASGALLGQVAEAWRGWQAALDAADALKRELDEAARQREFIAHAVGELTALNPEEGESSRLGDERLLLQSSEKITDALSDAEAAFGNDGVEARLSKVAKALDKALRTPGLDPVEPGGLGEALSLAAATIERALIEVNEASEALRVARQRSRFQPGALERIEARFFELKAAARKYNVDPDGLAGLLARHQVALASLEASDSALKSAQAETERRQAVYISAAKALTAARAIAAERLALAVATELVPLRLDKAKFRVRIDALPLEEAAQHGLDRVAFEISTNPGAPFGPLAQIASGGELARFALALKVCLAEAGSAQVLIFDEADQGVGGAVAAAVGERLEALARKRQVLAVTHSPQVAAAARTHLKIAKSELSEADALAATGAPGPVMVTRVARLDGGQRLEEVARMLSGATITPEARAAARQLLGPRLIELSDSGATQGAAE